MNQDLTITRLDSPSGQARWYQGINKDGEAEWSYASVTSKIDDSFPKGYYLMQWAKEAGIAAQGIFEKAGEEGTRVHIAIDDLLHGAKLNITDMNDREKKCLMSFVDFLDEYKPKILKAEHMIVNHKHKYAGTLDLVCNIDGQDYVVDYKTSKSVYDSHKLQVAAYLHAAEGELNAPKPAILHLGNPKLKKATFSFIEFDQEQYWEGFKLVNQMWDFKNPNAQPKVTEYPDMVELPKEFIINL